MVIIICVDDSFGLTFNKRRQSQDSVLRARVLELTQGRRLLMNTYTYKQFAAENAPQIEVNDTFIDIAQTGDYCFIENIDIAPYMNRVEKIIMYKWNRRYPSDFKFNAALLTAGWQLESTVDFAGSSHEKITEEVYVK